LIKYDVEFKKNIFDSFQSIVKIIWKIRIHCVVIFTLPFESERNKEPYQTGLARFDFALWCISTSSNISKMTSGASRFWWSHTNFFMGCSQRKYFRLLKMSSQIDPYFKRLPIPKISILIKNPFFREFLWPNGTM
jgi:hypothetical protein